MRGYPRLLNCGRCNIIFIAMCPRHKSCGNWKLKTGCTGIKKRQIELKHSQQQNTERKKLFARVKEKASVTIDPLILSKSSYRKKTGTIYTCKCGKKFYRAPSHTETSKPSCSYKCSNSRIEREFAVCDFCRREFDSPPSRFKWNKLRGHKLTLCSIGCLRLSMTGKNNPNWIIDRSKVKSQRTLGNVEQRHWRNSVFKRDNYTCQGCGNIGGNLEADHELPFALYPELRTEVLNGRTFCVSCHLKYGWRKGGYDWKLTKLTAL